MYKIISFALLSFLLYISSSYASDFDGWLKEFRYEAHNKGISYQTIDQAFSGIKYNEKVIKFDRNQPDFKLTFTEYMNKVVPNSRVQKAKKMYKKHKDLLEKIASEYNVQARFIVAIWGIESDFGDRYGDFNLVESLATLAYEGRRSKFFKAELINLLQIIDNNSIESNRVIGSWAGAMGQTQFMPSSFLAYGTDYDKDGKIDLWSNHGDIFASIANYLKSEGWNNKFTWGKKIKLASNMHATTDGWKKFRDINEWIKEGVISLENGGKINEKNIYTAIASPDNDDNNAYLLYKNFRTLMHWNKSLYFCIAVGYLSDQLYGI